MIKLEVSTFVNAPSETVFSYIADPDKYILWQPQVASWKPEAEPAVGVRATSVVSFLGRRMEVTGELTQFDPPKISAFKTLDAPWPMTGSSTVEPEGDGCRITQRLEVHSGLGAFFGKVAEPIVVRMYRRQMEANLELLKELAEAEA